MPALALVASGAAAAIAALGCVTYPAWELNPRLPLVPALQTYEQLQGAGFIALDVTLDNVVVMGPAVRCVPTVPPKMPPGMTLDAFVIQTLMARTAPGAPAPIAPPFELVDHCYPYTGR